MPRTVKDLRLKKLMTYSSHFLDAGEKLVPPWLGEKT